MSGFSPARLQRIEAHLTRQIDAGRLAFFALDLWRHGELVHALRLGSARDEPAGPRPTDATRYRWYSLSKPLTALTLLTFYEEGHFSFDTPLAHFLPDVANMQVDAGDGRLRPPARPIQMRDLFGHRAGFAYGLHPEMDAAERRYAERPVLDFAEPLSILVARAASLPLASDPGESYRYSIAIDLMAAVIERISGRSFGAVLRERMLEPLGMAQTGFRADPAALPPIHLLAPHGVLVPAPPGPLIYDPTAPLLESGGGGLIGTIGDAGRWLAMVLRGLQGGGGEPLSPATIRFATEPFQRMASDPGWTLDLTIAGFVRYVTPVFSGTPVSPNGLTAAGAGNAYGLIDPDHDLVAVAMTHLITPDWADAPSYALEPLIYQALA